MGERGLMLSISLFYPEESFMSISKQLGRKDFSMKQLPIDFYMMLLCKQKNSTLV